MTRLTVSAVVGIAVGYVAGPAAGFAAFSATYGATGFLDPNLKASGPRIDDLKGTTAAFGTPVPVVYGHPRIAGAIVWCSNKQEVATTANQGGKGGPSTDVTTFSYKIDVRILLTANVIAGVRRIWSNGKLIWSIADDASAATLAASSGATKHWTSISIYTGSSTQVPHTVEETALGIANCPAYRGRGSVFIEGLNLGGSGYLPNLTFEVVRAGTPSGYSLGSLVYGGSTTGGGTRISNGVAAWDGSGIAALHGNWTTATAGSPGLIVTLRFSASGITATGAIDVPATHTFSSGSGMSDVPAMLLKSSVAGPPEYRLYTGAGQSDLLPTYSVGGESARFLRVAGSVWLAGIDTAYIYFFGGAGSPVATGSIPGGAVECMAKVGGTLYVLDLPGTTVYLKDAATLTGTSSIAMPATAPGSVLMESGGTLILATAYTGLAGGSSIYRLDGTTWTLLASNTADAAPARTSGQLSSSAYVSGVLYTYKPPVGGVVGESGSAGPQFYTVYTTGSTLTPLSVSSESLKTVLEDLATRSGLSLSYLGFTSCAAQSVRSLAVSQVTPARTVMEMLAGLYQQEFVEGATLKTVARGGASVATIGYAQMGASTGDLIEPLPLKRVNDMERPVQFFLTAPNPLNDFLEITEQSDRLVSASTAVVTQSVPVGFSPQELKRIAEIQLVDSIASITSVGPVAVTRSLARLEPTDVVTYTGHDGSSYRGRILRITDDGGIRTLEGVIDDASAVTSVALTAGADSGTTIVNATSATTIEPMDIPIVRDADNDAGAYAAATRTTLAGTWPGAVLYAGIGGANFVPVASFNDRTFIGATTTALPAWTGGWVFDEVSTVTVAGVGTLSSYTRDAILQGTAPYYVIGSELLYARTATLVSAGVYTLSGLLRQRKGTEWSAAVSKPSGTRVVLLGTAGVRRVAFDSGQLGTAFDLRGVTLGYPVTSATSRSFTPMGIGIKPLSVVDVRAAPNGATYDLTWKRRTRLSTRFTGAAGISAPLGETTESYVVRVYSGATLLSTQTVSTAAATVTASAGNTVNIYQVGGVAGYETTKVL